MTTNVMDKRNNRVTSDTRWSFQVGDDIFYVDDTGFNKIVHDASAVMICAGNACLIAEWKSWFLSPFTLPLPPTKRVISDQTILVSLIVKEGYRTLFSSGWTQEHQDAARFSGSGSEVAKDCYSVNGCSTKCVETAATQDSFTGGDVQYVEFSHDSTNVINDTLTPEEMFAQFAPRGFVMNEKTKNVVPIRDVPPSFFAKAMSGALELVSAPTDQPSRDWTEREKHDVQVAMDEIRQLRALSKDKVAT